jgi:hypothetical protein
LKYLQVPRGEKGKWQLPKDLLFPFKREEAVEG